MKRRKAHVPAPESVAEAFEALGVKWDVVGGVRVGRVSVAAPVIQSKKENVHVKAGADTGVLTSRTVERGHGDSGGLLPRSRRPTARGVTRARFNEYSAILGAFAFVVWWLSQGCR